MLYKTKKLKKKPLITVQKCTMFSSGVRYGTSRTLLTRASSNINANKLKKHASYEVDRQTVLNTSHAQSQANVIIQGKTLVFQHNSFVKCTCADQNCNYKLCNKPCGPIIERADVGFATHSPDMSDQHAYLSNTDLNQAHRPQFVKLHRVPIYSSDQQGVSKEESQTVELNKNKEMLSNLHAKSSKQPTDYE